MKRFPGCKFGPMQVRRLLRPGRSAGERIVGWGSVRLSLGTTEGLYLATLSFLPWFGPVLAAAAMASRVRWLILTDRRVLVIVAGRSVRQMRSGRDVQELAVVSLRVVKTKQGGFWRGQNVAYSLFAPDIAQPLALSMGARSKHRASRRLIAGLDLLSSDPGPELGGLSPAEG